MATPCAPTATGNVATPVATGSANMISKTSPVKTSGGVNNSYMNPTSTEPIRITMTMPAAGPTSSDSPTDTPDPAFVCSDQEWVIHPGGRVELVKYNALGEVVSRLDSNDFNDPNRNLEEDTDSWMDSVKQFTDVISNSYVGAAIDYAGEKFIDGGTALMGRFAKCMGWNGVVNKSISVFMNSPSIVEWAGKIGAGAGVVSGAISVAQGDNTGFIDAAVFAGTAAFAPLGVMWATFRIFESSHKQSLIEKYGEKEGNEKFQQEWDIFAQNFHMAGH